MAWVSFARSLTVRARRMSFAASSIARPLIVRRFGSGLRRVAVRLRAFNSPGAAIAATRYESVAARTGPSLQSRLIPQRMGRVSSELMNDPTRSSGALNSIPAAVRIGTPSLLGSAGNSLSAIVLSPSLLVLCEHARTSPPDSTPSVIAGCDDRTDAHIRKLPVVDEAVDLAVAHSVGERSLHEHVEVTREQAAALCISS